MPLLRRVRRLHDGRVAPGTLEDRHGKEALLLAGDVDPADAPHRLGLRQAFFDLFEGFGVGSVRGENLLVGEVGHHHHVVVGAQLLRREARPLRRTAPRRRGWRRAPRRRPRGRRPCGRHWPSRRDSCRRPALSRRRRSPTRAPRRRSRRVRSRPPLFSSASPVTTRTAAPSWTWYSPAISNPAAVSAFLTVSNFSAQGPAHSSAIRYGLSGVSAASAGAADRNDATSRTDQMRAMVNLAVIVHPP